MIEPGLRILLANNDPVKGIVDDRVYFVIAPQNERRPRIVLTLMSAVPGFTFEGRGGYVNGLMQINCLAPTYEQAKQLAQAVRDAVDGYAGTQDGTVFGFIETDNTRDIPMAPLEGKALPTFGVSVDAAFMALE